jgi:hypothetical protein
MSGVKQGCGGAAMGQISDIISIFWTVWRHAIAVSKGLPTFSALQAYSTARLTINRPDAIDAA